MKLLSWLKNQLKNQQFPLRSLKKLCLFLLLPGLISVSLGWNLAFAMTPSESVSKIGTVDPVPGRLQLGQELYLESCRTCHIALPPAVLPSKTWQRILEDPTEHYGQQLPPIIRPSLLLIWDYLRTFSRPELEKEKVPFRMEDSRYFKALHPKVPLPQPVRMSSCIQCHPSANQYNFRNLTPEWENSP